MSQVTVPVGRRVGAVAVSAALVASLSVATLGASATSAVGHEAAAARLEAHLKPSGDPNGFGEAKFRMLKAKRKVCADVEWKRIAQPTAAHIHRKSNDSVVVDLSGSVTGGRHCARRVPRKLIGRMLAHPRRFYFNVHNTPYPAGAIKGTLRD